MHYAILCGTFELTEEKLSHMLRDARSSAGTAKLVIGIDCMPDESFLERKARVERALAEGEDLFVFHDEEELAVCLEGYGAHVRILEGLWHGRRAPLQERAAGIVYLADPRVWYAPCMQKVPEAAD